MTCPCESQNSTVDSGDPSEQGGHHDHEKALVIEHATVVLPLATLDTRPCFLVKENASELTRKIRV